MHREKETIMRMMICVMMVLSCVSGVLSAGTLPVSGQVVDYMARPVAGAEVVVYEREHIANDDYRVKIVGPIVKTDNEGRFALEVESVSQYGTFIVARKSGLAMVWDGLNYSRNTLSEGVFLLVMDKSMTQIGRVVDDRGRPVADATVQVVPKTTYMDRLSQRPMNGPVNWFLCKTDSHGVFRFDGLSRDVKSDFYVTPNGSLCTQTFTTHYQNCCGYEIDREDVTLTLVPTYPVRGCVLDESNQPLAGITVQISYVREREDVSGRYRAIQTTSDEHGAFVFEHVPEGDHQVQLAMQMGVDARWVGQPVSMTVGSDPSGVDDVKLQLEQGGLVEVVVQDAKTERPLSGMSVYVGSTQSRTNSQGKTVVRQLPGDYRVYVDGSGYSSVRTNENIVVKAGETVTQTMQMDKASMICGQVKDQQGNNASGVMVIAHPFSDRANTDHQGRFECTYEMERAQSGLYVVARNIERSLASIEKTKAFDQPLSLTLGPALTVQGKVVDPNGHVIPAARVSLCFHYSNCLSSLGDEVLTDSKGLFRFKAVPPQRDDFDYRISAHAIGYAPQTYSRVTIQGETGQIVDIDPIVLKRVNLSVSGTVVDANGLPAPRVIMFLYGDKGVEQPDKATATDEQGRFRFSGICEGPVRIQLNFSDSPAGHGTLKCHAGDRDVKGVLGQTVVHESFKTLKDRPLPSLDSLLASPVNKEMHDKSIVLIVFDWQQRPSRRAVTQLAKQIDTLPKKNRVVIAVDISGDSSDDLNAWAKEFAIPFDVVPLKGSFETQKLDWGVKSLPWIIVTDSSHIVIGEGQTVEETVEQWQ